MTALRTIQIHSPAAKPRMFLWTHPLEWFPGPKQRLFLWLYQFLARFGFLDWTFMNYGFDDGDNIRLALYPEDEADLYCIQLYERVTAGVEMRDKRVLEVGCGRGGGISYLHRYRGPRTSYGVDLSPRAVDFCENRHYQSGRMLFFKVQDALNLTFGETFDVVVNVESSHCYPSRLAFFKEAYRVLKPDGRFCFADLHEAGVDEQIEGWLLEAGFSVIDREDLTPGVLRALELDDARKRELIQTRAPWGLRTLVGMFAGCVGTRTHYSFVCGARQYTRWKLKKEAR